MTLSIARYELWRLLRSKQFWFTATVFGTLGFVMMNYSGALLGGGNISVNSPHNIQLFTAALTLFGIFLVASMVAPAVTRDFELDIWQVVFSYPISWRQYVAGKFMGSLVAAWIAFAFVIAGFVAGAHGPLVRETVRINPFDLWHYAYPFLVFGLVNLFVMGALLFALATLSRRVIWAYVGSLLLFILWSVSYEILNDERFEPWVWVFDAMGYSSYELVIRYWTPFELDTRLIPLRGDFLLNRAFWVLVGGLLVALTVWRFDPYPRSQRGRGSDRESAIRRNVRHIPVTPQVLTSATPLRQFRLRARFEVLRVMRSVPFLLLVVFAIWNTIAIARMIDPVFGSPPLPLTRVLINALGQSFWLFVTIIVVFYAAELVWRERQSRVDQIVDSLPVPSWVFFGSKLAAMWGVIGVVVLACAAALVAIQLASGTPVVWSLYVSELAFRALPFLWIGVLAFFFQVLSPNKFLGMLFMLIYLGLSLAGSTIFDTANFLVFGTHPSTDVSGLASQTMRRLEALEYDAYWAALCLVLAVLCQVLWRRGTDEGLGQRLRVARQGAGRLALGTALAGLVAFVGIGFALHREDVTNNPIPPSENREEAWQVRYEEVMRPLENLPTPVITSVKLDFDTYIETLSAESRGQIVLENRHDAPFEDVMVGVPMIARVNRLAVEGAEVAEEFPEIGFTRHRFEPPMAPGEIRRVDYDLELDFSNYPGGQANGRLETSGTAMYLFEVIPDLFGYNVINALSDPNKRRQYGLPENRAEIAAPDEEWGRRFNALFGVSNTIDFEGTYGVDLGQTAFLGGELTRTWEEGERAYFHYKSKAPISLALTVQQGEYTTLRDTVDGVALALHHHPADDYHAQTFMEHFKASVPYYSREFGRYPYEEFRIIQKAGGIGANSNSGQLTFGEFAGFVSNLSKDTSVDWGTHVIGHEAGHNWWGIMVTSAKAEGAFMLQETLAQYAGMILLEKSYGRGMVGRFLRHSLKQYHTDRNASNFEEVPLYRSRQETDYVHYWKGAPIIYGIKEMIGEAAMNQALADYFSDWAFSVGRYPTSLDLLAHLRAQTPAEYQDTISDGFQRILMHDLSVTEVEVAPEGNRFRVDATLRTRKLERTPEGDETPVAINEPLQVVVVDDEINRSDRYNAAILAERRLWVDEEQSVVTFYVDEEPTAVIVDPYHNFIERNVDDNVRRFE